MHLWPERVVPKCAEDASLAMAHGLDEVFWEKGDRYRLVKKSLPLGGWRPDRCTGPIVVSPTLMMWS